MPTNAVYGDIAPCLGFAEPVSSMLHLLAAAGALSAAPWLVRLGRTKLQRIGLGVFVAGAVILFALSGVYHLLEPDTAGRAVLQRLDHAAIWVLIAGTFTGIHILAFRGWWRWGMLGAIWTAAITGLVLKTVFFASFPEWLSLGFYLGLGWMGVLSFIAMRKTPLREPRRYLIAGGLAYSVGAVLEFAHWPVLIPHVVGPHELFHIAVIAGVGLHWRLIAEVARRVTALAPLEAEAVADEASRSSPADPQPAKPRKGGALVTPALHRSP